MFEFNGPFLHGPAFFRTALSRSGELSLASGGMPLHDAGRVKCKRGATTENQWAGAWYMG